MKKLHPFLIVILFFTIIALIVLLTAKVQAQVPRIPAIIEGVIFQEVMITEPSVRYGFKAQKKLLIRRCRNLGGELSWNNSGGLYEFNSGDRVYVNVVRVICREKEEI